MPQVDFYILDRDSADALLAVACRIAEKAVNGSLRVFMRAADPAQATRLDDLLWTFSQGSFVPHRVVDAAADFPTAIEPVLIGAVDPATAGACQVLINLAPTMPREIGGYARIAELIDANEERRRLGRERYKAYRDRGCELGSHNV